jgi:hypothetical protein
MPSNYRRALVLLVTNSSSSSKSPYFDLGFDFPEVDDVYLDSGGLTLDTCAEGAEGFALENRSLKRPRLAWGLGSGFSETYLPEYLEVGGGIELTSTISI